VKYFVFASMLFAAPLLAQSVDGKELYDKNCKECHGAVGIPAKITLVKFPKIVRFDSAFVAHHSVDSIVKILTKGKNDNMISFHRDLNDNEMTSLAQYIRKLGMRKKG
jgi:mono/diheme cytochrome c family protein